MVDGNHMILFKKTPEFVYVQEDQEVLTLLGYKDFRQYMGDLVTRGKLVMGGPVGP